jgi:2-polyprenyl-3-methyl-5-hydroxy-6-metoxy-1,4-benzoquinol methylase
MECCHGSDNDRFFDARFVRRELKRYRRRGPGPSTRELLRAIESTATPPGSTLLDVGGGVGAIHHRLLEHGFARATQVDASGAYLAAAAEETERRGHTHRVVFRRGDFHALAAELPQADVVTLDRVVCCDSDYASMLGEAAAHARRLVAFSYPRPRFITKIVVLGGNALRALSGGSFRTYLHPPDRMAAVLERNGLRRRWAGGTFVWAAEVFER